jgi:hypothetical protein
LQSNAHIQKSFVAEKNNNLAEAAYSFFSVER